MRWLPFLAASIGCVNEPHCERTGSDLPADNVQIQIRGGDRNQRPVVIHDRDGAIVSELATDGNGVVEIATVPAEASVTVDLGLLEGNGPNHPTLVTYFGLSSGDSLVLGRPDRAPRPVGMAQVTLRFTEPADPAIGTYEVSLGGNCGAFLGLPALGPGEVREVTLDTDCLFEAGTASLLAIDAVDRHVIVGAAAPFSVANNGATTVELGPWQAASDAVLTVSGSAPDGDIGHVYTQLIASRGAGEQYAEFSEFGDVVTQRAPYEFRMPFVPGVYDRVEVTVVGGTLDEDGVFLPDGEADGRGGSFRKVSHMPVDLAVEDWLPSVDNFELVDHRDGAPTLSWAHNFDEQVALAYYTLAPANKGLLRPGVRRIAVRHDGGCDCTLPPLPSRYEGMMPIAEYDGIYLHAGVVLARSPDVTDDGLMQVFDPLGSDLPEEIGLYEVRQDINRDEDNRSSSGS